MTLTAVESIMVAAFLLLLMLGMGATLRLSEFARILRSPTPLVIGIASQFGWMPLAAFAIAKLLHLPDAFAIGLIIMGSSSGGTSSNFFTYLARADLALSLSMTVASTVVGIVAIPLALAIYTRPFVSAELQMPFGSIVATLVAVIIPVLLGMFVRARSVLWAARVERIGTICGWGVLSLVLIGSLIRDGAALREVPFATVLAATALGPLGFALGLIGARIAGLPIAQRRAVSLETGIQNAPLALAIVALSFPEEQAAQILIAPLLYGVIVVPCSALLAFAYRSSCVGGE